MQIIVYLLHLFEKPDSSKNYFPKTETHNQYNNYTVSYSQNNGKHEIDTRKYEVRNTTQTIENLPTYNFNNPSNNTRKYTKLTSTGSI